MREQTEVRVEVLLLVFAKHQGQEGVPFLSLDLLFPLPAQTYMLQGRPWEVEQHGFPGNSDGSGQLLSSQHALSTLGLRAHSVLITTLRGGCQEPILQARKLRHQKQKGWPQMTQAVSGVVEFECLEKPACSGGYPVG